MTVYHRLLRSSRGLHSTHTGNDRCVWCGDVATTDDHLVPKWLLKKLIPYASLRATLPARNAPSCDTCNNRKGSMPAATFAGLPRGLPTHATLTGVSKAVRSSKAWQKETREWNYIAAYIGRRRWGLVPDQLARFLLREFARPFEFPVPQGEVRLRKERVRATSDSLPLPTMAERWPFKS